jgi:CRP-like cAMP-binding protein
MAAKSHHLDHLARVPLFSSLSKKDLQAVARTTTESTRPAGTVLLEQDAVGHELFIILEGAATVSRNGRKITTLGPGAFIGEMSLLDKGPRVATVKADTDIRLLVLTQQEFFGLLEEVPGIARKFLSAMASRLRDADARAYTHEPLSAWPLAAQRRPDTN